MIIGSLFKTVSMTGVAMLLIAVNAGYLFFDRRWTFGSRLHRAQEVSPLVNIFGM
jgi:hypothetical protein